ncbi:MAG: 4Fe-4S binding protein [Clostridia bacterium]|nr:4Fe-4S binding protein [Clostridiales bacterium]
MVYYIRGGKSNLVFLHSPCTECGHCMTNCPAGAIEAVHGGPWFGWVNA